MSSSTRHRHGFTLIELMITVAIIGLLAAIAIPNFIAYQARSRRSEAFVNLSALARAYTAYHAETGSFPDTSVESTEPTLPNWTIYNGGDLGTSKMPWDAQTESFYDIVGWKAEGRVFYSYEANSVSCGSGGLCGPDGALCFTLTAYGDVDGDGLPSAVMYVHPYRSSGTGAVLDSCSASLFGFGTPLNQALQPVYDEVAVQASTDQY